MTVTSTNPPRIFITGVTGQDGFYLARHFLARGAEVIGGAREIDGAAANEAREALQGLRLTHFDLLDPDSIVRSLAETRPEQVYHLAALTNVGVSWDEPQKTFETNTTGTAHVLEAMRAHCPLAHLVFAGTADCLDTAAALDAGYTPETPPNCTNPYSISKWAAMQLVRCYRRQYGLLASVAILMNHTSVRRSLKFIERRIVKQAADVARGAADRVLLGSLETVRDWSWAEDVVKGLAAMGARGEGRDFVLASGRTHTTADWVRRTFARLDLDVDRHLRINPAELHAGDKPHAFGNIERTTEILGWRPETSFELMVDRLVEYEMAKAAQ